MPISSVVTGMLELAIQVGMLAVVIIFYIITGAGITIGPAILLAPLLVIQTALLGCGLIIAALTTKYRDLVVLVSFGVQLWMYASPVVYTISMILDHLYGIYMLNPMASIITVWRSVILGAGEIPVMYWGISWGITLAILIAGIVLFGRIEKTFMDTV